MVYSISIFSQKLDLTCSALLRPRHHASADEARQGEHELNHWEEDRQVRGSLGHIWHQKWPAGDEKKAAQMGWCASTPYAKQNGKYSYKLHYSIYFDTEYFEPIRSLQTFSTVYVFSIHVFHPWCCSCCFLQTENATQKWPKLSKNLSRSQLSVHAHFLKVRLRWIRRPLHGCDVVLVKAAWIRAVFGSLMNWKPKHFGCTTQWNKNEANFKSKQFFLDHENIAFRTLVRVLRDGPLMPLAYGVKDSGPFQKDLSEMPTGSDLWISLVPNFWPKKTGAPFNCQTARHKAETEETNRLCQSGWLSNLGSTTIVLLTFSILATPLRDSLFWIPRGEISAWINLHRHRWELASCAPRWKKWQVSSRVCGADGWFGGDMWRPWGSVGCKKCLNFLKGLEATKMNKKLLFWAARPKTIYHSALPPLHQLHVGTDIHLTLPCDKHLVATTLPNFTTLQSFCKWRTTQNCRRGFSSLGSS